MFSKMRKCIIYYDCLMLVCSKDKINSSFIGRKPRISSNFEVNSATSTCIYTSTYIFYMSNYTNIPWNRNRNIIQYSILVSGLCMLYHNFIAHFHVISLRQSLVSGIYILVLVIILTHEMCRTYLSRYTKDSINSAYLLKNNVFFILNFKNRHEGGPRIIRPLHCDLQDLLCFILCLCCSVCRQRPCDGLIPHPKSTTNFA
jgi:hypothetical protein